MTSTPVSTLSPLELQAMTMDVVAALAKRVGRRLQMREVGWYFGYSSQGNAGAWLSGKIPPGNRVTICRLVGVAGLLDGTIPCPEGVTFRDPQADHAILTPWHEARIEAISANRPKSAALGGEDPAGAPYRALFVKLSAIHDEVLAIGKRLGEIEIIGAPK